MNRNRDIVAKCMVVHDIDSEEEDDVDEPSAQGHLIGCYEEWRPRPVELSDVSRRCHEKELHKGQECS